MSIRNKREKKYFSVMGRPESEGDRHHVKNQYQKRTAQTICRRDGAGRRDVDSLTKETETQPHSWWVKPELVPGVSALGALSLQPLALRCPIGKPLALGGSCTLEKWLVWIKMCCECAMHTRFWRLCRMRGIESIFISLCSLHLKSYCSRSVVLNRSVSPVFHFLNCDY